jgi:quercetin dioxygenase-like cupin family protein
MINRLREFRCGVLAIFAVIALSVALPSLAQDAIPKATKGISLKASSTLRLGEQIPALKGYALQIRTIILKPGAVAGHHSHANRPVVAYLVSGDYTEHRDNEGVIVHKPGEQWAEGADVAHWSENRGNENTYLINVEVFRAQ